MAYIHRQDLLERAKIGADSQATAERQLRTAALSFVDGQTFDVFISHSYSDASVIVAVKELAEKAGLRTYVDWDIDPSLDRKLVTARTAEALRHRMRACSSLVYVHSTHSSLSGWMPWELGYFDGYRPDCTWILPVVEMDDAEFRGREYVSLYPAVESIESLVQHVHLARDKQPPHVGGIRAKANARESASRYSLYFGMFLILVILFVARQNIESVNEVTTRLRELTASLRIQHDDFLDQKRLVGEQHQCADLLAYILAMSSSDSELRSADREWIFDVIASRFTTEARGVAVELASEGRRQDALRLARALLRSFGESQDMAVETCLRVSKMLPSNTETSGEIAEIERAAQLYRAGSRIEGATHMKYALDRLLGNFR